MSNLHANPQAAIDLLNHIIADSGGQSQLTTAQILQSVLNQLMKAERALHLEGEPDDKGNGFYERQLGTPSGNIQLQVPRDRNGNFRPQVLPAIPHQRDSQDRYQLLDSLVNACYSPNQIDGVFDQLGLHYNPKETERLKELYLAEFNAWKTKELPPDMIALFIDAYQAEMLHKGKVRKMTAFVAIGVDFRGHKELVGLYIHLGHESKEFWLQTLNDLIDRGLKRLVAVVSDDFSGLKDAQCLTPVVLYPHATQCPPQHGQRGCQPLQCRTGSN
jgi:transposase-like protein